MKKKKSKRIVKNGKGRRRMKRATRRAKAGKPAKAARRRPRRARRLAPQGGPEESPTGGLLDRLSHSDSTPSLSGGDVDADWQRAESSGEEAVGGSVATPDQDVVDEIGRALGVEQGSTAPVVTSDEILRDRDRRRWELERRADRRKGRA
jgi:hypothetical protein